MEPARSEDAEGGSDVTIVPTDLAALHYGVTDRTVRRWVSMGLLVNYGTARRVKVALLDIMSAKVCSSGEVSPGEEPPQGR